jgi:predicted dehydrogenase
MDEALHDPQVQGVVLCTPHTLHTEQIIKAANAKKHVFCEKPLVASRADVLRAVEGCTDNGVGSPSATRSASSRRSRKRCAW